MKSTLSQDISQDNWDKGDNSIQFYVISLCIDINFLRFCANKKKNASLKRE